MITYTMIMTRSDTVSSFPGVTRGLVGRINRGSTARNKETNAHTNIIYTDMLAGLCATVVVWAVLIMCATHLVGYTVVSHADDMDTAEELCAITVICATLVMCYILVVRAA